MKAIGENQFIVEEGEEITFVEDQYVLVIMPYDPTHIDIRGFNTFEQMNFWIEKEFLKGNFELKKLHPDYFYQVTELQT